MKEQKNTERFNSLNDRPKHKIDLNYTHWQLLEKIDQYERFTKTKEDRDQLLEIKDKYLQKELQKPLDRAKRDEVFMMGLRRGLTQDKTHLDLYDNDHRKDERDRNRIVKEAKIHYRKNFSVTKQFRTLNKNKSKDKSVNKNI